MKMLLLGGTTEASAIARSLAGDPAIRAVLSLAGRTRAPVLPPIPARIGGFGGIDGLIKYLTDHAVEALVDATHPFAAQMSRHAEAAAAATGVRRLAVVRPLWQAGPGDDWIEVAGMTEAAAALGVEPRRVFLTVGQQELAPFAAAPWHDYLIRSVDPPPPAVLPPRAECIAARGPFEVGAERTLFERHRIELLVTKNSGGTAAAAKLAAARDLGVKVIMVARPPAPAGPSVADAADAIAWLRDHAATSARRGV
jgi:precorrin-6A/cobalt-precorrin-6A reductase